MLQLGLYFLLTFLIAWGTWFPAFLHPGSLKLLSFVGLFAPALSAIAIVTITHGKSGVKELLGRYKILKFSSGWYILAIALVPLLFVIALLAGNAFFHTPLKNLLVTASPIVVPVSFVWLMFINSGEEIGWRGFALPRLQELVKSPVYASLVLGIFWSAWHLPIYLVPGQSSIPLSLFLFFTTGLSFIYTVLFNKTGGSLFSVVLLHASTDVVPRIIDITVFSNPTWLVFGILVWVSAVVLTFLFRKEKYIKVARI